MYAVLAIVTELGQTCIRMCMCSFSTVIWCLTDRGRTPLSPGIALWSANGQDSTLPPVIGGLKDKWTLKWRLCKHLPPPTSVSTFCTFLWLTKSAKCAFVSDRCTVGCSTMHCSKWMNWPAVLCSSVWVVAHRGGNNGKHCMNSDEQSAGVWLCSLCRDSTTYSS